MRVSREEHAEPAARAHLPVLVCLQLAAQVGARDSLRTRNPTSRRLRRKSRDQSRLLVRDDSAAHCLAQRRKAQQILLERSTLAHGLWMHPEPLGAVVLEGEKPQDTPPLDRAKNHCQMPEVLVPLIPHA